MSGETLWACNCGFDGSLEEVWNHVEEKHGGDKNLMSREPTEYEKMLRGDRIEDQGYRWGGKKNVEDADADIYEDNVDYFGNESSQWTE